jgi:hypothetical protein
MTYHTNPDDALRYGEGKKAVGDVFVPWTTPSGFKRMIVVYETSKTPYIAYPSSPGVKIRPASAKEVENARRWRNIMNTGA